MHIFKQSIFQPAGFVYRTNFGARNHSSLSQPMGNKIDPPNLIFKVKRGREGQKRAGVFSKVVQKNNQ